MRKTFEVVDDFYRNPLLYRERALKDSSPAGVGGALDDDEAARRIFQLLGWQPEGAPRVMVCGYFTLGHADAREPPAMQLENFSWAGLVCLSLPESRPGGVGFYRREQTPDGASRLTMEIPARFNRMVLFQTSALSYGASPGFEKTSESGPLVQLLAFSEETALTR